MDTPSTVSAETALTRQAIALSTVKQAAQADRAAADILDQALRVAPVSSTRGTSVDLNA